MNYYDFYGMLIDQHLNREQALKVCNVVFEDFNHDCVLSTNQIISRLTIAYLAL